MSIQTREQILEWLQLTQLARLEERLVEAIRESDAPFLGLLGEGFSTEMREVVEEAIAATPSVTGYIQRLKSHPGLFAVNLAWHVMRGMGEKGKFSLYPHIQRAIKIRRELSVNERESLWRAFRITVLSLGLDPSARTSGTHYMANEYLRQAGVPLPFVDDLAKKMLAFGEKVGLPDDDDPEGIAAWQAALDSRLGPPFSQTARDVLKLDRLGYYTRVFLRVYANQGRAIDESNTLEKEMVKAFAEANPASMRRAGFPQILYLDGCLGISLPGGGESIWTIEVDGVKRQYRTETGAHFVPFAKPLPNKVMLHCLSTGHRFNFPLWVNERANRLLFFSDTGRLVAGGELAQTEPLVLAPGGYTVLSRFHPAGIEIEEVSDDPLIVSFRLKLTPGATQTLANGPARIEVLAESAPSICWYGNSHVSKEGVEFFYGAVDLVVELPADWQCLEPGYELRLNPGASGSPQVIPIQLAEDGSHRVNVIELAAKAGWKPGLMRLLVELRRTGETRNLMRKASLCWLGLREISRGLRFRCVEWPENLKFDLGENLRRDGNDLVVKDVSARTVRLVFDLSLTRQKDLTWNVPGIFVEVETVTDGGVISRSTRSLGSTEAVSLVSDKQIVVNASDPGTLSLGEWSQRVDFTRQPTKLLAAAFLASRLTPQSNVLIYKNDVTGLPVEILKLTQPHEVSGFSVQPKFNQLVIRLHVAEPVDAISVRAWSLTSGDDDLFTLQAKDTELTRARFGQARLMVLDGSQGGYTAYVYLNLDYWPAGAWLFDLSAQIKGVWGSVQNNRQDAFAAGLLWSEEGKSLAPRDWLAQVSDFDDKGACKLLKRIHIALQACYAQEAWLGIAWLSEAWKMLIQRWLGREVVALSTLADMLAVNRPAAASPSWLPQVAVSAELPSLFTLPAENYRLVNEKRHPIVRATRAMASVSSDYPAVFGNLLHPTVAVGFRNFRAIACGAKPEGFEFDLYTQALIDMDTPESHYQLRDESFLPGPGEYLGPLHYRQALRALEDAYDRTLAGNDIHRGQALGLCQEFRRRHPSLDVEGTPGHFCAYSPHFSPWPYPRDDAIDVDDAQRYENLGGLAHLIAWFAFVCRMEARQSGVLKDFLESLQDQQSAKASLTYILQIGEGMFAYYILLWELALKAEID